MRKYFRDFLLIIVVILQCFIIYENYNSKEEIVSEILQNNIDRIKLQKIYDVLIRDNHYSKPFKEFVLDYGTSRNKQEMLYDLLYSKGYYTKTFDEFIEQYF